MENYKFQGNLSNFIAFYVIINKGQSFKLKRRYALKLQEAYNFTPKVAGAM